LLDSSLHRGEVGPQCFRENVRKGIVGYSGLLQSFFREKVSFFRVPMLQQIRQNLGRQAQEISADSAYCSELNLKALKKRHIRAYVATDRQDKGSKCQLLGTAHETTAPVKEVGEAATGFGNRPSSRSSDRSNKRADSDNSYFVVSEKWLVNGACSAPHTIF